MEPTQALIDVWNSEPEGEYWKERYYAPGNEAFQRAANYITNASNEELDRVIEYLEGVRGK